MSGGGVCQAGLVGVADGLGAVAGAGLGEDPVDVGFHGGVADEELLGDLGVAEAGGEQGEDFGFAGGEPGGQLPVAGAGFGRIRRAAGDRGYEVLLDGGVQVGLPGVTARIAASICSALASLVR